VWALWRGTGAAVTRILPYSAFTFTAFPAYNNIIASAVGAPEGGNLSTRFAAGALCGGTATVLTYPLDLLHARSAAHSPGSRPLRPLPYATSGITAPSGFTGSIRHLMGRGLHSSTFRLNVGAFCGMEDALRRRVGGV
jgi:hypothetical protein